MAWIKNIIGLVGGYKWIALGTTVGAAAIFGYAYFLGNNHGVERGYDNAYERYQLDVEEFTDQWQQAVENRDEEWANKVMQEFQQLNESFENYQAQEQKERELRERIAVLNSTLQEIQDEYENSDLGGCDVSPDFDGLLRRSHEAATARAEPTPDGDTRSATDSSP